jgi:hypothetical protein
MVERVHYKKSVTEPNPGAPLADSGEIMTMIEDWEHVLPRGAVNKWRDAIFADFQCKSQWRHESPHSLTQNPLPPRSGTLFMELRSLRI